MDALVASDKKANSDSRDARQDLIFKECTQSGKRVRYLNLSLRKKATEPCRTQNKIPDFYIEDLVTFENKNKLSEFTRFCPTKGEINMMQIQEGGNRC